MHNMYLPCTVAPPDEQRVLLSSHHAVEPAASESNREANTASGLPIKGSATHKSVASAALGRSGHSISLGVQVEGALAESRLLFAVEICW
jgi:hypothetical protein